MRISAGKFYVLLTQLALAVFVITMAVFLELPWLAVVCVALLFVEAFSVSLRGRCSQWGVYLGWGCTVVAWNRTVLAENSAIGTDFYFSALAGGIAIALLLSSWKLPEGSLRTHWRLNAITWAFMTALICVGAAYEMNLSLQFYVGVLIIVALLIAAKFLFRMPALVVQVFNTLIVLLIGLPLADLFVRPSYGLSERPDARSRLYSYEEARKNPTAFAHWWYYFVREWRETQKSICIPATNSPAPFRLRPESDGEMFESHIHINQLGFRGPEISARKGNAYRIVTLGESTTFGHTMYEDDVPWPRVLERMITNNLRPHRPVQVINAGIPSYTLRLNLRRLHRRILALKPDMIISYHGYNGFEWLMPSLPPVSGAAPPEYKERPLKLLADCEYRLKVMAYRNERASLQPRTNTAPITLMDNEYARGYRELIDIARTNGIHLVLANFSMAANAKSDLDVIAFYRSVFPEVLLQIRANELHSKIVETLARRHPGVTFVDTHPALDGQYDEYIDLVHFTQEGRNEMAQTMFSAIRPVLENDFAGR